MLKIQGEASWPPLPTPMNIITGSAVDFSNRSYLDVPVIVNFDHNFLNYWYITLLWMTQKLKKLGQMRDVLKFYLDCNCKNKHNNQIFMYLWWKYSVSRIFYKIFTIYSTDSTLINLLNDNQERSQRS